ncbi:MAG: hypothetical protein ACK4YM_09880 [Novosphingobium sp.]
MTIHLMGNGIYRRAEADNLFARLGKDTAGKRSFHTRRRPMWT